MLGSFLRSIAVLASILTALVSPPLVETNIVSSSASNCFCKDSFNVVSLFILLAVYGDSNLDLLLFITCKVDSTSVRRFLISS